MMTTVKAELPRELVLKAQALIVQGWASGFDELLADALRRYLESRSSELTESLIRQDVAWGLSGRE